jgi:mannose-6-phosphate isomerase-like protein (cupin superfamily)
MKYLTNPTTEFHTTEQCHIIEVINQADHPDVSLAQARVESGVTTRWHTVEAREIYYILSGEGKAEVGEDSWPVGQGDAVSIPPLTRQRITNTGTEDLVFLCVCTPRFTPEGYQELPGD